MLVPADKPVAPSTNPAEHAGSQWELISAAQRKQLRNKAASDERWNRIFEEKFADPDYYKPRPYVARGGSPLADF